MKKFNFFRVLVVMLLVALAVPSVALAADPAAEPVVDPKVTAGKDNKDVELDLLGSQYKNYVPYTSADNLNTWTVTGTPYGTPYMTWTSSNESAVQVEASTVPTMSEVEGVKTFTFAAPTIYRDDVCEKAAITGTLYYEDKIGNTHQVLNAASFNVTLKEVKPYAPRFVNKKDIQTEYGQTAIGRGYSFPVEQATPDGKEPVADPTYGDLNVYGNTNVWWKVSDTKVASVTKSGRLTFKKAGTVTLYAYLRGGDPVKDGDSITFTVTEQEELEETDAEQASGGYTSLAFTADKYTFRKSSQSYVLYREEDPSYDDTYTIFEGNRDGKDTLIWESSDKTVATVNNGELQLKNKATDEKGITISVKSKLNPAVKAQFTLVVVEDKDETDSKIYGYSKLSFSQATETLLFKNDSSDLSDYLISELTKTTDTIQNVKSSLIWTSEDKGIVAVSSTGVVTSQGKVSPQQGIKITVTSKYPDEKGVYQSASMNVIVLEDEDPEQSTAYEVVEFAIDSLTLYEGNTETMQKYLNYSGKDNLSDLIVLVSDDNQYVDVTNGPTGLKIMAMKATDDKGVKVTAYSKNGTKYDDITIIVKKNPEDEDVAIAGFKFVTDKLTLYLDENDRSLLNLYNYLSDPTEPGVNDYYVWSSADKTKVRVNDGVLILKDVTDDKGVEITVASFLEPANNAKINVIVKDVKPVAFTKTEVRKGYETLTYYEDETGDNLSNFVITEDDDATDHLVWTSSDEKFVTVSNNGSLTLKNVDKEETVTITARSYLKSDLKAAVFTVTVKPVEEKYFDAIKFTADKFTVKKSVGSFDAKAYTVVDPLVLPDDTANSFWKKATADLIWTSSDTTVATVNNGAVTFVKTNITDEKATVTISVRSKKNDKLAQKSFELTIVNDDEYYTKLEFAETKGVAKFTKGGTFTIPADYLLKTIGTGNNGDKIICTVDDPTVATVAINKDGIITVTFKKVGTVKITARSAHNPDKVFTEKPFELTIKDAIELTSITAIQNEFTVTTADSLNLYNYLNLEPVKNDDDLIWTSSDPYVLDVAKGVVTVKKPGTAKITVRSKLNRKVYLKDPIVVTVEKEAVKVLKFKNAPSELRKDQRTLDLTKYLTAEPYYYADPTAGNYVNELVWTSSNPLVATVQNNGIVTYQNPGNVKITVADETGKVKAAVKLTLTEVPLTAIKLTKKSITLNVGESFELDKALSLEPVDTSTTALDYQSSDRGIATVSENGTIVAVAPGTAKITVAARNDDGSVVSAVLKVAVKDIEIESMKFAKSKYTFKVNKTSGAWLRFTVYPLDANVDVEDLVFDTQRRYVVDAYDDDGNLLQPIQTIGDNHFKVFVSINNPGASVLKIKSLKDDKVYAKTAVKVEGIPVKSVKITEKTLRMNYYQPDERHIYQNEHTIYPIVKPANAYYNVKWETSNAAVAFVNNWDTIDGKPTATIVATGEGSATLKMIVDDGKKTYTAKVKVIVTTKEVNLKLSQRKATINMAKGADNSVQLQAIDADTNNAVNVKWTSSNPKVATVVDGLVVAKKAGTVKITATSLDGNETKATCTVKVNKLKVTAIKGQKELTMVKGEEKTLSIKVKPTNAYNKAVKFSSSAPEIVSVDGEGKLVANEAGEAVITVKAKDGSKVSLQIKVTVTKR